MKFGIRNPSLKKSIAARTSVKRMIRHKAGLKAPRGWGWLTNPKRAAKNASTTERRSACGTFSEGCFAETEDRQWPLCPLNPCR